MIALLCHHHSADFLMPEHKTVTRYNYYFRAAVSM